MQKSTQGKWVEDELNLLNYWRVLVKRSVLILTITFISVFITGSYCYFIATKIFESKASILAPRELGGGSGLASTLAATGAGQLLGGMIPSATTNRDSFIAILRSQTMAEDLIAKFKLKEHYGQKYMALTIKSLQEATDIRVSKEGVISIKVEDKDPKLAAEIANTYVTNLDRIFVKMGTSEGSRQRVFIAQQIEKTEKDLRGAEEALRRFQERNKTIAVAIEEQAKSAIESSARLKGEIRAAEVALDVMRTFATENNPDLQRQRKTIDELKRQLANMEYGRGLDLPSVTSNPGEKQRDFSVPFAKVPEVGLEMARLMREVKVQETVFTLLTQQYEQAKIAEARDTPTVQILDQAKPAEFKSKPKTVQSMILVGALSFFISVIIALSLEVLNGMRKEETEAATRSSSW